jgi:hypothetical protein
MNNSTKIMLLGGVGLLAFSMMKPKVEYPHNMYSCSTGVVYIANNKTEHDNYATLGYVHDLKECSSSGAELTPWADGYGTGTGELAEQQDRPEMVGETQTVVWTSPQKMPALSSSQPSFRYVVWKIGTPSYQRDYYKGFDSNTANNPYNWIIVFNYKFQVGTNQGQGFVRNSVDGVEIFGTKDQAISFITGMEQRQLAPIDPTNPQRPAIPETQPPTNPRPSAPTDFGFGSQGIGPAQGW